MAGFYTSTVAQALTANGDTAGIGYVSVADTTGFVLSATVSLAGTTAAATEYEVVAVDAVNNRIGLRILFTGTPRLNGQSYGLTSVSQYTTADSAVLTQPAQFISTDEATQSTATSSDATTAAVTLYVATTGNDNNPGTSVSPCLTIQGAYNKLPKRIRHAVTVNVAAGSYAAGGTLAGFIFETGGYLLTRGTRVNATVATGTATGTFTSGTTGSSSSATWGTATDSGQSWTVDDLRGKWVYISSGTGSGSTAQGSLRLIVSNTATTLTVAGNWTAPNGTSVYSIQEPATIITGLVTPPDLYFGANTNTASFILDNNLSSAPTPTIGGGQIIFQDMKFTANGPSIRMYNTTRVVVERNWFAPGNAFSNAALTMSGATPQTACLNDNFANYGSSVFFFVNFAQLNFVQLNRNIIQGGTHAIFHGSDGNFSTTQNQFKSQTGGSIVLSGGTVSRSNMTGDRIDNASNGQPGISWTNTIPSAGLLYLFAVDISNCSDAINLAGPIIVEIQSVTGTGNTTGMQVQRGASFHVNSATTLTGTTGISVDGVTTDLATMRAATPKLVGNTNYGSKIWE